MTDYLEHRCDHYEQLRWHPSGQYAIEGQMDVMREEFMMSMPIMSDYSDLQQRIETIETQPNQVPLSSFAKMHTRIDQLQGRVNYEANRLNEHIGKPQARKPQAKRTYKGLSVG